MNERSLSKEAMSTHTTIRTTTARGKLAGVSPVTVARPETKGERTRAALVEAGYNLFLSRGYHGTSMRDIAQTAGIALGGIYNHFDTKEDIFLAIVAERHPYMNIVPALQAASGETIEDLVSDAAMRMIDALGQSQDMVSLMFIEQVEFNGKHIAQLIKQYYPGLKEFGARLQQVRGSLRPIPQPVLLRAFIGLFFSYYMTERLIVERQSAKHAHHDDFAYFVEIFLHGVLAKG
jgi:AcrR family transcriptional regulator